jgi:hypothetical protein
MAPAGEPARVDVTMRRMAFLAAAVGVVMLGGVVPAAADEISGGCTATVNGRDVASITRSDPLVLPSGTASVNVSGSVPPAALAAAASSVTTSLDIDVADSWWLPGFHYDATGHAFSGNAEIPGWVRSLAAGLWKMDAVATGTPGGWRCAASIYVKVGGPLTAATAVGAGAAVAGAAVTASAASGGGGRAPRPKQRRDTMVDRGLDALALLLAILLLYLLLGIFEVPS